jgi:XTP/dITP diphosphohydrolase
MISQGNIVIIATRNQGKVREFAGWFQDRGIEIRSLADYENLPEIVEDGDTFAANARIKAEIIAAHLQLPVLADDSGLCVDALGGAPGVYSARYAGEHASDADNNAKLLRELAAIDAAPGAAGAEGPALLSAAHFVCALALVDPLRDVVLEAEGTCPGYIIAGERGTGGFGYDPLFYMPEYGRTMAELPLTLKNEISHRANALKRFFDLY